MTNSVGHFKVRMEREDVIIIEEIFFKIYMLFFLLLPIQMEGGGT